MNNSKDKYETLYKEWEDAYLIRNPKRFKRLLKRYPLSQIMKKCQLTEEHTILEAGCGGGQTGIALALLGCRVTFLDFSERILKNAQKNIELAKSVYPLLRAKTTCQDIFNITFDNNVFDLSFNSGVFEHYPESSDRINGIREMARVTKKNGAVVIMIPNNIHPFTAFWKKRGYPWIQESCYDKEYIISPGQLGKEMEEAGLRDIYVDGFGVYETLRKWPKSTLLSLITKGSVCLLPEPFYNIRLKYGTSIYALGFVK